jgi:hypothetical protein
MNQEMHDKIKFLESQIASLSQDVKRLKDSQWEPWETKEMLDAEFEVIKKYAKHKGVYASKLPMKYRLDYGVYVGDRLMELVEIKCRKKSIERYPTLCLSLDKVMLGMELSKVAKVPFVLLIQWTDAIGYTENFNDSFAALGGWETKDKETDQEPMFHVPIKNFILI